MAVHGCMVLCKLDVIAQHARTKSSNDSAFWRTGSAWLPASWLAPVRRSPYRLSARDELLVASDAPCSARLKATCSSSSYCSRRRPPRGRRAARTYKRAWLLCASVAELTEGQCCAQPLCCSACAAMPVLQVRLSARQCVQGGQCFVHLSTADARKEEVLLQAHTFVKPMADCASNMPKPFLR